ncbi:MAG: DUF45 domain-containing protein [Rickettsiaceae bacterium H1]|nr:DUF45 domain-containing protein [Rickettsiaceae bacterium H1]
MLNVIYFSHKKKIIKLRIIYDNIKKINIYVYPKSTIIITAPIKTNKIKIIRTINKQIKKIVKKVVKYSKIKTSLHSLNKQVYMGKNYNYQVIYSNCEQVKLVQGTLMIHTLKPSNKKYNKMLLNRWKFKKSFNKWQEKQTEFLTVFARPNFYFTETINNKSFIYHRFFTLYPSVISDYIIYHIGCSYYFNENSLAFYSLLNTKISNRIKNHFRIL